MNAVMPIPLVEIADPLRVEMTSPVVADFRASVVTNHVADTAVIANVVPKAAVVDTRDTMQAYSDSRVALIAAI